MLTWEFSPPSLPTEKRGEELKPLLHPHRPHIDERLVGPIDGSPRDRIGDVAFEEPGGVVGHDGRCETHRVDADELRQSVERRGLERRHLGAGRTLPVCDRKHPAIENRVGLAARSRIDQALSLLESDAMLDEGLALAMMESANDEEFDLEEAKRIVGRK